MPDIKFHIDTARSEKSMTVCDVQSAYWKIPLEKKISRNNERSIYGRCRSVFCGVGDGAQTNRRECLTLKPSKIHFGPKKVHYLGHILSSDGIHIITEGPIKVIAGLGTPTCIKEPRAVQGTINFMRKFIPGLATVIELIVIVTRKSVEI